MVSTLHYKLQMAESARKAAEKRANEAEDKESDRQNAVTKRLKFCECQRAVSEKMVQDLQIEVKQLREEARRANARADQAVRDVHRIRKVIGSLQVMQR